MKFTGAVLLWTAFSITGARISLMLKKRVALIEDTILFFNAVSLEIGYAKNNIAQIIFDISADSNLNFLKHCCKLIAEGAEFPLAWNESVNSSSLYKREEKERLLQLGNFLGVSDAENQIKTILLYSNIFESYKLKAVEEYKKYGKISGLFGVFTGAAIFILLL